MTSRREGLGGREASTPPASTGEFGGRIVLVTGGARGLGRAIVRAFATRGAHVIINYFHAAREAPELMTQLAGTEGSAELLRASVASRSQVDAMFDQIAARHGRLDVLVNNAASGALLPLSELAESHWQRAFDTNLRAGLWCARRAAPLMAGGGAIVNLSSLGSSLVISDYAAVGTTKAAVEALTRYLAVEFAPDNIRVNTASGGLLDGAVARMFPNADALAEQVRAATPLRHRLGTEEELANVVLFLASEAASWITGQTVIADGGLSLGATLLSPALLSPAALLSSAPRTVPAPGPAPMPPTVPAPGPDDSDDGLAIAVVGMGVVTPGANDPSELWRVLSGGRHVFCEPQLFDINGFYSSDPTAEDRSYTPKSGFITGFAPHPRLRAELDAGTVPSREPTALWLRHSLYCALAGVARGEGDRYFASVGYTADGSQAMEQSLVLAGYRRLLADLGPQLAAKLSQRYEGPDQMAAEYLPHRVGRNAIAGILPDRTELVMVDAACSSSLYAVDLGIKALRERCADIAVCGGAFAYTARNLVLFSKLSGLSRSGEVRCFDRAANGVLFSDGAGVVILKRLDRARADGDTVLAVIESVGLSCDGRGKAIYAPNPAGQVLALRRAYGSSPGADLPGVLRGSSPGADLNWMIAHATGTQAGDSAELASLHQVVGDGPRALLSSNKAIVGHTGWAAGIVSLVQALTGLMHRHVPAQPYLRDPIAALDGSRFTPPREPIALPARGPNRVGVSAFGFGGTNAHVVLSSYESGQVQAPATGAKNHSYSERERDGGLVPAEEDIVVVGWAAELPGQRDIVAWLRGLGPAPEASFGADYPIPPVSEVRLPPATMRNMDRGQLMVLRAFGRLPDALRAACARNQDVTGVIAAHMGPTRRAVHYALRCYLGDLRRCLETEIRADTGLACAVEELTGQVRALVPASTEDSFPGIMPNIIPARLAALANFRGLNLTVDTGPDSALDAFRAAERYLRHGNLDLVLVAAVNGNSTPELAVVLAPCYQDETLAEGAFVIALARESTAARENLPVLGRIRTTLGATEPSTRPPAMAPLAGSGRTYLGADPSIALLAHMVGGQASTGQHSTGQHSTRIGSSQDWGTQLDLTVPATPPCGTIPVTRPMTSAETDSVARPMAGTATGTVTRAVRELARVAPRQLRSPVEALPPGTLLLVDDEARLGSLRLPDEVWVVTPPVGLPHSAGLPESAALEALLPEPGSRIDHVRVIAVIDANRPAEDLSVLDRVRVLHDLTFLAAKRWSASAGASFEVLLLDAVAGTVPHPATGVFTGLVKSLAREAPAALSFAVLTDEGETARGLELLTAESARAHPLGVVIHAAGHRYEYLLRSSELDPGAPYAGAPHVGAAYPGAAQLSEDSVVVAAGGSRGLTAEILAAIAERARPAIYLLGRHAPAADPGIGDRGIGDPAIGACALGDRAGFLASSRQASPRRSIGELSADYDRQRASVQTRRTIDRLTSHCGAGRVHHLVCDLTDPGATAAAVDQIHRAHQRVDLLINAAGIHHGGTVRSTPLHIARAVRDTKLLAYRNLAAAFAGRRPRRWYNFGSLLAVLGWPGEADYCSANDLLNAAASWQRQVTGAHETTLAWALWDETGFAAEPVIRDLLRRQDALTGVSTADGVALFLAELTRGEAAPPGEPEVTYLGDAERRLLAVGARTGFFFADGSFAGGSFAGGGELAWQPDPVRDRYLLDHLLRGVPTLPGALIAEMAAEAAAATTADKRPIRLCDLRFHAPVTVRLGHAGRSPVYRASLRPDPDNADQADAWVLSDVTTPDGVVLKRDHLHAQARVVLGTGLPTAPPLYLPGLDGDQVVPAYYGDHHAVRLSGPFRSLLRARVTRDGAAAEFGPLLGEWAERFAACRIPVLLLDALVQLALLAEAGDPGTADGRGMPLVPVGIQQVELFTELNDVALLARYGTEISVAAGRLSGAAGAAVAAAPDGTVLIRATGIRPRPPALSDERSPVVQAGAS